MTVPKYADEFIDVLQSKIEAEMHLIFDLSWNTHQLTDAHHQAKPRELGEKRG